ncbi:protein TIC 20-v, chloroplastic [Gastrolobium bilobum]|uniref:protein TIC 20-v, chloroplastic n=1 Tax=Gastrolobium bilobum TaxID=150636 RepID=UPI002AB1DE5F|nr:protein TIC 20-v, chloroplastic [Gastrolobium bilobum]
MFMSMATSTFLSHSASLTLSFSHKSLHSPFLFSSTNPSLLTLNMLPKKFSKPIELRRLIVAKSNGNDSADASDRLISALCYFYPFFDGIQYGKYVITQFYPLQAIVQPLVPAIRVFKSFPFNGFLVFLTLYFVIVRNPNFSRYVRFNTMQAIVLDVLLIFPDLLERSFNPRGGLGLDLMMSLDSTVFLFLLVCLIYGSSSCLLGQIPRLPIVAEAADRQVL